MFGGIFGGGDRREAQISSLEAAFPLAQCKQADKSVFDLPFDVGNVPYTLRIFLPRNFPEFPPVLQLLKPLKHEWVNQNNQVVGHAYLAKGTWNEHFELAQLVKEVLNELMNTPNTGGSSDMPPIRNTGIGYGQVSIPDPVTSIPSPHEVNGLRGNGANGPPAYANASSAHPHRADGQPSTRAMSGGSNGARSEFEHKNNLTDEKESEFSIPVPPIPERFEEIEAMTLDQVERLLRDDVAFSAHLMNMDSVKTMRDLREQVIEENAKIAQSTLQHRDELEALRAETLTLQLELQQLKEAFDAKAQVQIDADAHRSSDNAVLNTIRLAVEVAEEESEDVASEFNNGDLTADAFVKKYLPLRAKYHQRNAALENSDKWMHK